MLNCLAVFALANEMARGFSMTLAILDGVPRGRDTLAVKTLTRHFFHQVVQQERLTLAIG